MTPPASTPIGVWAPLAVILGALCFSVSGIMVKLADIDPMTTAVMRLVFATIVLIPFAVSERMRKRGLSLRGVMWAVAAGAALGIDYAAWTAAVFMVGAGVSAVLVNIQVIVLPLLAFFIDKERITRRFLLTAPIMLLGISMLGGLWQLSDLGDQFLLGTLLCLIGGLGYSIYLFVTRRVTRHEPGLLLQPLMWGTLSATVTSLLISPFAGGVHLTGIPVQSWWWLVAMAVVGYVLAWLFIQAGSVQLPPAVTAALLLTQPVLALVLSAIILFEHPTPLQLVGAAIVIIGIAASNGLLRVPKKGRRGGAAAEPAFDASVVDRGAQIPGPVDTGAIPIIRPAETLDVKRDGHRE